MNASANIDNGYFPITENWTHSWTNFELKNDISVLIQLEKLSDIITKATI